MQVNISKLKQIIRNCPDGGNVLIHIREYEDYDHSPLSVSYK